MITRKRIVRMLVSIALAAGGLFAAGNVVHAVYPTPPGSIVETHGCDTTSIGGDCIFTFQVLNSTDQPEPLCAVTFTEGGVAGTVNPKGATSDSSGNVSTTFTAGNDPGAATVTASCPDHGSAGGKTTVIGGAQGITTGNGNGNGSVGLPNTGASAPGPSPIVFFGLGLALMIIIGGAVTLRRSSDAAS